MKLGGHLSTSDGLRFVALNARALGYNCIQIMLGEPEGVQPFVLSDETADEYKRRMRGIETFVHLPFNLNPCEVVLRKRNFYKAVVRRYLRTANMLGAKGVVTHLGHMKNPRDRLVKKNVIAFLESLIDDDLPAIIVETDAGSKKGTAVGSLEFCSDVVRTMGTEKVRLCIDTCHLWARGVNLWDTKVRAKMIKDSGDLIGLVHLNAPDKDVELGSYQDRHNSPFSSFRLDSEALVIDLVKRYPCILERRSLAIQKLDSEYIYSLFD